MTVTVGLRFTSGGQQELQAAADKGSEALRKLGETAKRSNDESRRAAQQYTDTLRRQADTLGMSRSQVMAYEAAQHKLTDAQRQSVQASIASINAYDRKQAILGRVRVAATAAGLAVGTALVAGLKASVTAAAEAEQAQLRLEAVLRGTGYTAGFTGAELDKMASKFQDRLGIDDETVKKSMATLLTFKQVGRESFEEVLTIAADISAVTGSDLQSSIMQVGKAMENPIEGLTALTRSGVSFTAVQKEMIKEMVETGNQAEAITTILQIMKSQGLDRIAETMNTGVTGASNDLKNSWNDLLESIGKTPAVSGTATAAMSGLASTLKDIRTLLDEGDWTDLAYIMNPLAFAMRGARVADLRKGVVEREAQNDRELQRGHVGARTEEINNNRRVEAAREQVTTFLGAFKSDNDKLADELRKFRALAGNAGLTAAETDAGVAKIQAKYAKKGSQAASGESEQLAAERKRREEEKKALEDLKTANAGYVQSAGQKVQQWNLEGDALAQLNESMSTKAQALQLEIDMMGMSDAQREKTIALKQLENTFDRESAGLSAEKYEEAYRLYLIERDRISRLLSDRDDAQALRKTLADAKAEQTRFNDDLARGLTDSIFRGFESGKSFAQNFWDSMKNMAKTTILQPVVKFLVSPITGAVGSALGGFLPGIAGASSYIMGGGIGGGIGQGLGGLGNLGSLFSGDGLSAMAAIPNAIFQNAGVSMGSQFIADIGNFGFGAPVMGAVMNLLSGNVKGAVGSAALGTLGTMFGGPIGGAIGSLVGGMFGGGSSGGPASFTGLDVSGTVGAGGLTSSRWLANSANSKQGFSWESFDHGATGGINALVRSAYADMAALADALGLEKSRLNNAAASFSFRVTEAGTGAGPTTQEVINAFGRNIGQLTDQLAYSLMPNLREFAQANETATQTLVRLVQVQEQLRQAESQMTGQLAGAVRGLPGQLGITSLEGTRNALAMSEYVSPIDRLSTARSLLTDTYNRGLAGDLTAVNSYGSQLQQALTLGREVGASGPAFQALFQEGNRQLNDLLARQQTVQQEILRDIDVSILQASQDQITELKKGFKAMTDGLAEVRAELRRIAA